MVQDCLKGSQKRLNKKAKLLTLILSHDSDPFKRIQTEGQDSTFLKNLPQDVIALRYFGTSLQVPRRYKLFFMLRQWQYSLLHYSRNFLVGPFLRFLLAHRFGDRVVQNIPFIYQDSGIPEAHEMLLPGKSTGNLFFQIPEDWSLIGLKTLSAFRYVLENYEFEFLFRTNTSSFVDLPRLLDHLNDKPKTGLYAGVIGTVFQNDKFASGAGILMSRDVVERICLDGENWKHGLIDDIAIGELVAKLSEPSIDVISLPRLDLNSLDLVHRTDPELIKKSIHLRCKSGSALETIEIMKFVQRVKSTE